MHISRSTLAIAGALAIGAGSTAAQSSGAATEPMGRWTAVFKPSLANNASVKGAGTIRASGNITIARADGGREGVFKVDIRFALPNAAKSGTFFWGVVPGRCGSGGIPVTGPSQNPTLELGANGTAEISVEVALNLKPAEGYHINVYDAGVGDRDEAIISCSELKYNAR